MSTGLKEYYGSDSQLCVYHARFARYLDQIARRTLDVYREAICR